MTLYQKVLSAGIALALVAFFAVGGTTAFFSDTEVSANNTFAAGEVDVEIQNIDHNYEGDGEGDDQPNFATSSNGMSFTLSDLKPLDEGTIEYDLENNGNPAFVCAAATQGDDRENGLADAEQDLNDSGPEGELQDFLSFKFGSATGSLSDISGQYQGNADEVDTGSTTSSSLEYCFGEYDGNGDCQLSSDDDNIAQTDQVDVDIMFQAIQQRNQPEDFTCDDLNDNDGNDNRSFVGANLDGYEAPSSPDATVSSGDSIQNAVNNASSGDTILVEDGTYTEDITVDVDNLTIASESQGGAVVSGGFEIAADGVMVTGFETNDFITRSPSEKSAFYINNNTTGTEISYNTITAPAGAKNSGTFAKGILTVIASSPGAGASGITVEHNRFDGWRQAAFFNTANHSTSFNDFYNNDVGVANDGPDSSSITRNDFENNSIEDVGVNPSADNGTGNNGELVVNTNNLAPAGSDKDVNWYGTSVSSGADVDATGNWWDGDAAADRANNTSEVDVTSPEASAYPEN